MAKVGRNEPCPCGSGKKFKKCCMRGPSEQRMHGQTFDKAVEKATEWLLDRYPLDVEDAVQNQFIGLLPDEYWDDFMQLPEDISRLVSINAYEWLLAEGLTRPDHDSVDLLELVLGPGGPLMEADQRQFLENLGHSILNLYEVVGAKKGQSLQIRELVATDPSGEVATHWVFAPVFSQSDLAKIGTVIGLRMIPGTPLRLSDAAYYFPGSWTADVLTSIRKSLADTPHLDDRQFAFSAPIISHWLSLLAAKPPNLIDQSSGDPILMVNDHYQIEDEEALVERLGKQPDVEYDEEEGWAHLEKRADGRRAPLITLNRGKQEGRLEVFGRTLAYSDNGRIWLEEVAGDAIRHIGREISDPLNLADVADLGSKEPSPEDLMPSFSPEQLTEIIGNHYRSTYDNWADEPIPALDHKTPRDAIETPEGRRQVVDLLDSYRRNEERMATEQGREPVSFDFLRREVGLLD